MSDDTDGARFLPARQGLRGVIRVPGDKSISHRAVLLGSVNDGSVQVEGFLRSADTLASVAAVRALGVTVEEDGERLEVRGTGWEGLREPQDVIDVANSGTLIRLLPGLLASSPWLTVLTGDASIRRRPMGRVLRPLAEMGASVLGRGGDTLPPIALRGGILRGITHEMPVASAQVKSCVLLAGLRATGPTTVVQPAVSRDHTERLLSYGGGRVEVLDLEDGRTAITVWPIDALRMEAIGVPGDFSSAAFFLVGAVLTPGSHVTIENVGLNPTRTALLQVLERMGAAVDVVSADSEGCEPVGTLQARHSALCATDVGAEEVPNLIDELPLFLLAAAQAEGVSHLRGAAELRAKESDRLQVMATTLRALGVQVEEFPDGMDVHGRPGVWDRAEVVAEGDHRMAMVGAVAGLISRRGVDVDDPGCIGVSFPSFVETLEVLGAEWTQVHS